MGWRGRKTSVLNTLEAGLREFQLEPLAGEGRVALGNISDVTKGIGDQLGLGRRRRVKTRR